MPKRFITRTVTTVSTKPKQKVTRITVTTITTKVAKPKKMMPIKNDGTIDRRYTHAHLCRMDGKRDHRAK